MAQATMNSGFSLVRIGRMAGAGAVGGLVTFLLVNPSMVAQEEGRLAFGGQAEAGEAIRHVLLLGMVLGMSIGAALVAAEELETRNLQRLGLYTLLGLIIGAICGVAGSIGGQFVFSLLLGGATAVERPSPFVLIIARSFGWAALGAAAGLCPGVVSRSPRRVLQGILGGVVGGGIGGILFDALANLTQSGSLSRAVGFVTIGALIGALVSLVEEYAKQHWLTALTGSREGRAFILAKDAMLLGRNEMADIPLFGDLSVQRLHARLLRHNGVVQVVAEPGQTVSVNNRVVSGSPLTDGDILGIGGHRFRFNSRCAAPLNGSPLPGTEPLRSTAYAPVPGPPTGPTVGPTPGPPVGPMPMLPDGMVSGMPSGILAPLTRLEVISGPHLGLVFALTPGAIIGRDPRSDIPLVSDLQASRQHARLVPDPSGWRIEDGGSSNGTWVNGQRIANHPLQPGDQIGIGQSILRVV